MSEQQALPCKEMKNTVVSDQADGRRLNMMKYCEDPDGSKYFKTYSLHIDSDDETIRKQLIEQAEIETILQEIIGFRNKEQIA